jgi:hypothetical protein
MPNESSRRSASRFVPDHSGDEIECNAHLRKHGRHSTAQVMGREFADRQLVAPRQEIVPDMACRQRGFSFGNEERTGLNSRKPRFDDLSGNPDQRRDAGPLVFRARGR